MSGPRVPLPLAALDGRIEERSRSIQDGHEFWPCRRGCDTCCRTLSRLPRLTPPEWKRLQAALESLPDDERAGVLARVDAAPARGAVVCPLLDDTTGECQVYEARPIVCRMHGFYTERDGGLHCADVGAAVAANEAEYSVVWGNGESVQGELETFGAPRSLRDWLREPVVV